MSNRKINLTDIIFKLRHEVSYFREYITFNVNELNKLINKTNKLLEKEIREGKTDEKILRLVYEDDLIKLPSYFYHSTIVSICSLLENSLFEICEKVRRDLEFNLSVNDFNTNDNIGKSIKYLEKFISINFNKDKKEWNKLIDFRTLRNKIVHQNSKLSISPSKEERDLIKRLKYIYINTSDSSFFVNNSKLIVDFIDLVCNFLEDIFKQVQNKEFKLMEIIEKSNFYDDDDLPF